MKIVCDNCATKYSIADEKVRGKVFKIRCKKCSHIIVVRGGADGSVEATSSRDAGPADGGFPGAGEEQQTIAARSASEAGGDAVWHLVIDREQVGPLSPAEVRAKFSGGEVDAETYAWREGFGDWLRLGSIEDFRDLGGDAPATPDAGATRRTDAADLFAGAGGSDEAGSDAPAGDLFGGGAPAPAYSSAPAPANEDVFGNGGGGGALFSAPSAAPAPSRQSRASSPSFGSSSASAESSQSSNGNVVDVRPMTGQRNENSVLFSLNNLQALATGGAGGGKSGQGGGSSEQRPGFANSQTEGSGLIDIRAMAASTLAASPSTGGSSGRGDDLPGLGAAPVFSPMAAPILMPSAPSGPPQWMWAILGVGVLAVLGIVVVGALLLTRKPAAEPTVVAQAPGAPAATAPAGTNPAAAKPVAGAPATAPAVAAAPTAAAPAADEGKKHPAAAKAKSEKAVKFAKNEPAAKAAEPAPAAAAPVAAAPAAKHSGKRDELDDLLNNASPGDTPKAAAHKAAAAREESGGGAAASDDSLPDTLDKGQIVSGMSKVKGRVQGCFDQFKVPGTANVAISIGPSGRVSSANVTGQFAGTPTGECVAKAVKTAGFPRFKGSPMSFVYPYLLR